MWSAILKFYKGPKNISTKVQANCFAVWIKRDAQMKAESVEECSSEKTEKILLTLDVRFSVLVVSSDR